MDEMTDPTMVRTSAGAHIKGGDSSGVAQVIETIDQNLAALLASHRAWFRSHDKDQRGLSASEYAFLSVIHQRGTLRPSDSDLALHFTSTTVSQYALRLERKGLLARAPHPHDGRGRILSLTPLGVERLSYARDNYRAFLRSALGSWTTSDIDQIRRCLTLVDAP
jgi:DNA-binding MarR family transcriptional regulator